MDARQILGRRGEDIGAAWLEARGMRIVERNFRCTYGEIDIIGQIGETLVFVEVRGRSSDQWGTPAESVNSKKKKKLRTLAACYLSRRKMADVDCRFDVVGILYDPAGNEPHIEWIPNAF
ncbi:MAG: YraN family protein [Clostridiales bacterium]|nr:YraN family protein [Clostridiales bacterium]